MNAQDNDFRIETRDAELLASVDRVLTQPELTPDHPDTFEQLCVDLAAAAPRADPTFQTRLHEQLTHSIEQRGTSRTVAIRRFIPRRGAVKRGRSRLISAAAAVLVAAGGLGAYLHQQSPTPVSAQAVLQKAEAVTPGAGQAMHLTYTLSAAGGVTGTAEVWVGSTGNDSPPEIALTQTVFRNGRPAPDLSTRLIEKDGSLQVYDAATNTVTVSDGPLGHPSKLGGPAPSTPAQDLEGILVGTHVTQKLGRAMQAGMQPASFQLRQQTLDGASVYALALGDSGTQTYYFNTQSYVLQGADWTENGVAWQARLAPGGFATMALSAAPANTFTLNAPSGAHRVVLSTPVNKAKDQGADEITVPAAAVCGTTPQALSAAMSSSASILAACQRTAPSMTLDRLVTAVIASFKSTLDAQVAAGHLTAAAEATQLANLRTKLTMVLGGKQGSGPAGTKP